MMKRWLYGFVSIMVVFLAIGCKQDTPNDSSTATDELESPLPDHDYEENPYQWGFINRAGNLVVVDQFDEVRSFQDGLALVRRNGRWAYIQADGKQAFTATFRAAWPFQGKWARAQQDDGLFGYINRKGEWALSPRYEELGDWAEGMAFFREGDLYGYIDTNGTTVVAPQFEKAADFIEGAAIVASNGKYGLIDKQGKFLIECRFKQIKRLSTPDRLRVKQEDKWGITDYRGKWVLPPKWLQLGEMDDNYVAAMEGEQWGLLSLNGQWSIRPDYDQLFYAGHHLWIADAGGNYSLLTATGDALLSRTLSEIHPFSEGFACFRDGELWGYMDASGRIISAPQYFLAWPFQQGLARVATDAGLTFIDTTGRLIWLPRPNFLEIREYSDGLAPVQIYK
ncbi:MAG: WG repeat-containing protein [Saprospiraceae bacterium]